MPFMIVPLIVLAMALIIGVCGRNQRFGFWGLFFATLLFTPLIGILLLLAPGGGKTRSAS